MSFLTSEPQKSRCGDWSRRDGTTAKSEIRANTPTGHATQKPVRVFEIPILNHTTAQDAVYDPFVGSGTTLMAGEALGRSTYAMDVDPIYVEVAGDAGKPSPARRPSASPRVAPRHAGGGGRDDPPPRHGPAYPPRGGQQGYEPPVTRMRRDERLLDLALERWNQRQIAAEVGLTQGGVSKALRRIFTRQLATLTEETEASRVKLVLLAERRARAAREGHARSQADVTTRRQRKVAAGGGAAATTVVKLDTQSAAGNPTYLAVEQRCDEFAAKLLGVYDPPALPVGARPRALDPAAASVSASSATSRQTRWSVPMPNSPDLLTRALQNPTLREAELGRRRARDGTDGDVLAWVEATFGVRIPAVACCPGHVAPAQAFCDALRARASVTLWIASRGFGGKTFLLALLAAANAILFETDVIILGGSGQQSLRVVDQLHGLWAAGQVPPAWLASAPSLNKTNLGLGQHDPGSDGLTDRRARGPPHAPVARRDRRDEAPRFWKPPRASPWTATACGHRP